MKVERFERGKLLTNGYVVYDHDGGEAFIIDAGYNPQEYVDYVKSHNLTVKAVLLTHHHYDHSEASPELARMLGVRVKVHKNDYEMLKRKIKDEISMVDTFDDDAVFEADSTRFEIINTKGHTKGGVFFIDRAKNIVFTGDTIFPEEIGLTSLEDGSPEEMSWTCKNIVMNLPDDMVVYPGHCDSTTIGRVKIENPEFKDALKM